MQETIQRYQNKSQSKVNKPSQTKLTMEIKYKTFEGDFDSEEEWATDSDNEFHFSETNLDAQTALQTTSIRSRSDIPKYLLDLSENSPYYNPKSRSFKTGESDNSGEVAAYNKLVQFSALKQDSGQDISLFTLPTQAEILYEEKMKEKDENM